MLKVIILYNKLFHYRIPFWNELAKKCDLTVAYSEGDDRAKYSVKCDFKIKYLPAHALLKRFVIQTENIRKLVKQYDVIVAYGNIAWLKYSTLPWFSKNKIVFHTLGVSASYNKGYDQYKKWDRIRSFFYKKASALAFYTEYPIEKYVKLGIPKEKMFVACNTVQVSKHKFKSVKDSILFIGTLYKEKGINILLEAYKKLSASVELPKLNIIGDGPEYNEIKQWIEDNNMTNIINLVGPLFNIEKKAEYFSKALACVSPRQAGLTVLESMGYGVPFITTENAITGGELSNITNMTNGVVLKNESELLNIIEDISKNKDKYILMGERARDYYENNRTVAHMAEGLWSAIEYAYDSKY